jgi:uncharacterized protein
MKRSAIRKRSSHGVTVFSLDREECLRAVRELSARLCAERPEVEEVILFGSLATGRAMPGSDADLLLILRESPDRFLDRMLIYKRYFSEAPLPCDVLPYTRAEVEAMREVPGIVRSALLTGVSLVR